MAQYPAANIMLGCPRGMDICSCEIDSSRASGGHQEPERSPVCLVCYSYFVHRAWTLCLDLIRQLYPVICEPIRCDTVLLFYHFDTISHSADSGALIGRLYCLAGRSIGATAAPPGGASGCGAGESPLAKITLAHGFRPSNTPI